MFILPRLMLTFNFIKSKNVIIIKKSPLTIARSSTPQRNVEYYIINVNHHLAPPLLVLLVLCLAIILAGQNKMSPRRLLGDREILTLYVRAGKILKFTF